MIPAIVHWRSLGNEEWVAGIEPDYDWSFERNEWALRHSKDGLIPTPDGLVADLVDVAMLPIEIYGEFRSRPDLKPVLAYMDKAAAGRLDCFKFTISALNHQIAASFLETYTDLMSRRTSLMPLQ